MKKTTILRTLLASLFVASMASTAHAEATQTWPRQPITIVVPFAAGGGTDSIAREFALELGKELGQAVVVENRGGGGGSIGASRVAQAKPDGYTLLFATSTFATNSAWEKSTAYDPKKSFTPIALLGTGPLMLVANKDLGITTVGDLLKKAKDEPNSINYCSAGPGSINHLSGALFQQLAKVEITHVPYRGSGPATLDLLAGRVQVFFSTMPTMLENVKANKVLLLGVTTKERSGLFPEVATLDEAGIPGFDISTWWGILGPASMPASIVEKLNLVTNKITGEQLVRNRLASEGATVFRGSASDFQQKLLGELAMWEKVVGGIEQR